MRGRRTATGVLTTLLSVADKAADEIPFPGAKAAIGGILEIVNGINKTNQNKKALAALRDDLHQLCKCVVEPLSKSTTSTPPPELRAAIDGLVSDLVKCSEQWKRRSKKAWIIRFFQRDADADDIQTFSSNIKASTDRFMLSSNVRQEIQGERIIGKLDVMESAARVREISALFEELGPVKIASHLSPRPGGGDKCCEGTRISILESIDKWMTDPASPVLYWLNGMAGVGKTTIALTAATGPTAERFWVVSFFCSRQEASLRDSSRIIPTIAYQLANLDEELKRVIGDSLNAHRTIASESTNRQLDKLLLEPLRSLKDGHRRILVVLDALDECEDRGVAELLRLIAAAISKQDFPTSLKILITCRPERHIRVVLTPANPSGLRLQDIDKDVVDNDIATFLEAELDKITAELELEMDDPWITIKDKKALVQRSEGIFVAASTMLRFIGDRGVSDPRRQLRILLGLQKSPGANRYGQLDQLYLQVLASSVASTANKQDVIDRFQKVVGSVLLLKDNLPLSTLERLVAVEPGSVKAALAHLHSVVSVPTSNDSPAHIYHTSFREFLTSPDRCSDTDFLVIETTHEARLALCCLKLMIKHLKRDMANIGGGADPLSADRRATIGKILAPEVEYACRHWGSHLSRAKVADTALGKELGIFVMQYLPYWIEALCLLGEVPISQGAIRGAVQSAPSLFCPEEVTTILGEMYRLIHVDSDALEASPLGVYASILRSPASSALFQTYSTQWPMERNLVPAGQAAGIWSVAFSPDGSSVAGGLVDRTVRIWDTQSGVQKARLRGHTDWVVSVAFCPLGARVASSSHDKTACIWRISSGEKELTLNHPAWVNSVSFLRDGSRIGTGAEDGHIRLWNASSGELCTTVELSYGPVTCVTFSPNGALFASSFFDTTIAVWDADFTNQISNFTGHTYIVASITFNPEGTRIVSGSWDATARAWDPFTGELLLTMEGHASGLNSIAHSPDGKRLISASDDKTVRLWDTETGEQIGEVGTHSHWAAATAFSPDGLHVASASWDGTGAVWDTTSLKRVAVLVPGVSPPMKAA